MDTRKNGEVNHLAVVLPSECFQGSRACGPGVGEVVKLGF